MLLELSPNASFSPLAKPVTTPNALRHANGAANTAVAQTRSIVRNQSYFGQVEGFLFSEKLYVSGAVRAERRGPIELKGRGTLDVYVVRRAAHIRPD